MLIHVNDAVTLQGARALRQPLIIPYGIHQEYELQIVTGHDNAPVDVESRGCVKWTLTVTPSPETPTKVLAYAVFAENIATGSYLRFDLAATSVEMYKHVAGNPATPAVLQLQGFTEEDAPATLAITLPVALVTTAQQRLPVDLSTALMQELQLAVSVVGAAQREISKYAGDSTDAADRAEQAAMNARASEVNAAASATAAGVAAENSRNSEDAAEGSAIAAAGSASEALVSAEAAHESELAAGLSESNAKDSEDAAKSSEEAAKASEDNAKASEDAAHDSEVAAKASEDAALVSQNAAHDSEVAAKASEDAALASQNAAHASEVAAKASEDAAKDSEVAAKASEDAAALSESNAKDSENAAKVSENAAALSESNAKDSENAAKASENAAALSEDNAYDSELAAAASAADALASQNAAAGSAEDALASQNAAAGSAAAALASQNAAHDSEVAAKSSEDAAKASEDAAADSQADALASKNAAAASQADALASKNAAALSESNAKDSEDAAKASEDAAALSEQNAKASEDAAKDSEDAAKASEDAAKASEDAAKDSEDAAALSEQNASTSETNAAASAKLSESWAKGDTGVRDDEDTNNAKYWAEQSMSFSPITKADKVTSGDTDGMVAGLDAEGNLTNTEIPAGNVAQKDGYYAEEGLGAATAENLIDPKATPTRRQFGFDTACGDVSISDDGNAIIDTLRGTTQVVNQLVGQTSVQTFTGADVVSAPYAVGGGVAGLAVYAPRTVVRNQHADLSTIASWAAHSVAVSYDDGVATLTHNSTNWSIHGVFMTLPYAGHCWAVRCKMRVIAAPSVIIGFSTSGYGYITNESPIASVTSQEWTEVSTTSVAVATGRALFYIGFPSDAPSGVTAEIRDLELVDLSQYFLSDAAGSYVARITSWDKLVEYDSFFADYHPYNPGTLSAGVSQTVALGGASYAVPETLYGYGPENSLNDSLDFVSGKLTRWWGTVDLGTLTWRLVYTASSRGVWGAQVPNIVDGPCFNPVYFADTSYMQSGMANKTTSAQKVSGIVHICIRDDGTRTWTADQFKEHVSGMTCVYWHRVPVVEELSGGSMTVPAGTVQVSRAQDDQNRTYAIGLSCEVSEWDETLVGTCKYIYRDQDGVYNMLAPASANQKRHVVGGSTQLISLSHWFGRGLEPSMEGFFKLYPTWKDAQLPYIGYEVLNYKGTGVATVGFNAYDHSTGTAVLLGGNKYQICGTYESVAYADLLGNEVVLELDSQGIFTPPVSGTLTVTGGNDTDTCVHLCWSGYKNYGEPDYKWEPYVRNEKLLPVMEHFPDGMNGINSQYDGVMASDTLTADGKSVIVGTYTFTGSELWTRYLPGEWSARSHAFDCNLPNLVVTTTSQGTKTIIPGFVNTGLGSDAGIVRTGYGTSAYNSTKHSVTATMNVNVQVNHLNYGQEVAAYMKGRTMYLVRSAPVETEFAEKLNLIYPVNDFGTEQSLPVNTTTLLSTDLDADIKYSLDFTRLGVHFSDMEKPLKDLLAEEPNLARQDGYYAKQGLGAKTAENIVNPNAQPADASFGFRTAAGEVSISDDSTATVAKFLGTTYIRNQLVGESGDSKKTSSDGLINADFANSGNIKSLYVQGDAVVINQQFRSDDMRQSVTMNGAIVTSLGGDGVMTLDTEFGGVTEDTEIPLLDVNGARVAEYAGHVYAMYGRPDVSGCYIYMSDPQHAAGADGCVWTSAVNGLAVCYLHVPAGTTLYEGVQFRPQIVDVTQLYNGVSSRIADVTSWRKLVKLFPQYKDAMPYNPGEVVFLSTTFRVYQDEYAYGFTYDPADGSVQRVQLKDGQIGEVASFDEFDRTPCHQLYRCVMDDLANRHIAYYLDDEDSDKKYDGTRNGVTSDGSASVLTGADGDVMVEFPIGWWSCEEDWNGTGKTLYLMSDRRFRHSRIHPFFYVGPGGNVARKQYIGAYKGAVCDAEGNPLNTTEGVLTLVAGDADTRTVRSIKGALPWCNISRNTAAAAANRRGACLSNWWYTRWMLMLMVTEAGTMNTQTISVGYSYARIYAYYLLRLNGKINFGNGTGELLAAQDTTDADAFWQFNYRVDGVAKAVYRTASADANGYYGWSTNHDPETGIYCWTNTPTPGNGDAIYTDTSGTLSSETVYYVLRATDYLRACKFQYRGVEDPFGCLWEFMDGWQGYQRVLIDSVYNKTSTSDVYWYDRARNGNGTFAWSKPDRSETIWTASRSNNVYAYADAACSQSLGFQVIQDTRSLHDCGYWWTTDTSHYNDTEQQSEADSVWRHVDIQWPWKSNNVNASVMPTFKSDDFMPLSVRIGTSETGIPDSFFQAIGDGTTIFQTCGQMNKEARNGMGGFAKNYTATSVEASFGVRISA